MIVRAVAQNKATVTIFRYVPKSAVKIDEFTTTSSLRKAANHNFTLDRIDFDTHQSAHSGNLHRRSRYWHLADIPVPAINVRFGG
jgi:hypothetical protein